MTVRKVHAYDGITGRYLGRVPAAWFDTFPHLSHTDPDGERPHVAKAPKAKPIKRARQEEPPTDSGTAPGDHEGASA